jgi:hypothetical protein
MTTNWEAPLCLPWLPQGLSAKGSHAPTLGTSQSILSTQTPSLATASVLSNLLSLWEGSGVGSSGGGGGGFKNCRLFISNGRQQKMFSILIHVVDQPTLTGQRPTY